MSITNVRMLWCRRTAKCRWCDKQVEVATPMVIVSIWRRGDENSRKSNLLFYYHPKCWVEQGLDYLKMNPYTAGDKGRPKVELSPEDADKRRKLIMRKAALEQRKGNMKLPYPDNVLETARLNTKIAEILEQMLKVGGIPKSWIQRL